MTPIKINNENSNYDKYFDVLYVTLDDMTGTGADIDFPGGYIFRNDADEVKGMTLMDYKARKDEIARLLPQYRFEV